MSFQSSVSNYERTQCWRSSWMCSLAYLIRFYIRLWHSKILATSSVSLKLCAVILEESTASKLCLSGRIIYSWLKPKKLTSLELQIFVRPVYMNANIYSTSSVSCSSWITSPISSLKSNIPSKKLLDATKIYLWQFKTRPSNPVILRFPCDSLYSYKPFNKVASYYYDVRTLITSNVSGTWSIPCFSSIIFC